MLKYKYISFISLVSVYFLAELIVGFVANSAVLQTDAFHMLSDLLALAIGFGALLLVDREPHHRYTYGWTRAEIIGGTINSVFLLAVCFMLVLENIMKFVELSSALENPSLVENIDLVIGVGSGGLVINLIGIALFHSHAHSHGHGHGHADDDSEALTDPEVQNMATSAVFLHIVGDTLGSLLVVVISLLIKFVDSPELLYLDPAASLLIVTFIGWSSGKLLRDCIRILMHRWAGVPTADIVEEIQQVDFIMTVHEFHVWSLNNNVAVASLHAQVTEDTPADTDNLLGIIKDILHKHGIHCSAIQIERSAECMEPLCGENCADYKCCVADIAPSQIV